MPDQLNDDEKVEAVNGLLALYGGWMQMADALLGREDVLNYRWRRYHELQHTYAKKHSVTRSAAIEATDYRGQIWPRVWKPAFWDAIQESEL